MAAQIIPLPGAAKEPVLNPKLRTKLSKRPYISLETYRLNRNEEQKRLERLWFDIGVNSYCIDKCYAEIAKIKGRK